MPVSTSRKYVICKDHDVLFILMLTNKSQLKKNNNQILEVKTDKHTQARGFCRFNSPLLYFVGSIFCNVHYMRAGTLIVLYPVVQSNKVEIFLTVLLYFWGVSVLYSSNHIFRFFYLTPLNLELKYALGYFFQFKLGTCYDKF